MIFNRISKVYRWGNVYFGLGQISEIKTFSGPYFQVRRGKFSKSLGSKFVFLVALSNCFTISATFSNAFFGKRQHFFKNFKIDFLPALTNLQHTLIPLKSVGK